jgi:hypothetical protein
MGISGFYNYIKKDKFYNNKSNKAIINKLPEDKKYDFLFFDFQSGIYSVKNELLEYDYLIRLIYYIKFQLNKGNNILYNLGLETKYKIIIDRIYLKFKKFIGINYDIINLPNDSTIIMNSCNELICAFTKKTNDDFNKYFVDKTFDNTLKIINDHKLSYNQCYIFFDGVPSIAKLKEQLIRRIEPIISNNIQKKLYNELELEIDNDKFNINEFLPYLSISYNIQISVDTPIINELIYKFKTNTPDIYINDISKYGEAEHQIMRFIENNGYQKGENKFFKKSILLSSPDSDLILFAFIMYCKNYYIDIYKYEFISDNNFLFNTEFSLINPYCEQVEYILIEQLIKNMLTRGYDINQSVCNKLLDLTFILLILGDDYLPTIPNIDVNNISDIIFIYNNYKKNNSNIIYIQTNFGINISKYVLNFNNFKIFLNLMSEYKNKQNYSLNEIKLEKLKYKINNNKIKDDDYCKVKEYYFIDYTNKEEIFKKIYYFNKGLIMDTVNTNIYNNFLTINEEDFFSPCTEEMLKKYCEGCSFIIDIYYNNNLQNYFWYYPFEKSPRMNEIADYIQTKIKSYTNTFDYYNKNTDSPHGLFDNISKEYKYFSRKQYSLYINKKKKEILDSILKKINEKRKNIQLSEYSNIYDAFIYDNINIIYSCINKIYINKCLNYDVELNDANTQDITNLKIENFTGGYYEKYIKYKIKYIKLKKNMKENI